MKELFCFFSSNTPDFLERLGGLPADGQNGVCSRLCYYRTSGAAEEQDEYQHGISSAVQLSYGGRLSGAQKQGYSVLGVCNTPVPAARTAGRMVRMG